jgi:hypothetical protein
MILSKWIPYNHDDSKIEQYWTEFKEMYGKKYQHDVEWLNVRAFVRNHEFVATKNAQSRKEGKDLRLEINEWADMTYDQFIQRRGGFKGTKKNVGTFTNEHYNGAELAATVDWRSKDGVLSPVQNQQQCGSCWAFSATCAIESG